MRIIDAPPPDVRHPDDPLPPAFFPVSLNLEGRRVVVIGDDREAIEKEQALREVKADVVWITDAATLRDEDVTQAFFVLSTPQDEVLSARLRALADVHKFMLCTIDQPKFGFVSMVATASAGPARVTISTGGVSPRVGGILKAALQKAMDGKFARFLACLQAQRARNRSRYATSPERRAAMMAAAKGFDIEMRVQYPQWFEAEIAGFDPHVVE
jgi:siroheme synthase (precorrin-2 oxidase/ferrochelatase)